MLHTVLLHAAKLSAAKLNAAKLNAAKLISIGDPRRVIPWLFVWAALGSSFSENLPSARAAELESEVRRLIDTGWQTSSKAFDQAELRFAESNKLGEADFRAPYAMVLVAIKHRRYSRALVLIDDALALKPSLWSARKTKLWLLVVLRQNEAAMEWMGQLTRQLAAEKLPEETLHARCRYLGRLFAYMESPSEKPLADALIRRYQRRVMEPLDQAAQIAFDDGRDSLMADFVERQSDNEQTRTGEKQTEAKRLEEKASALADEKAQTADAAAGIEQEAATLQAGLDRDLKQVDDALAQRRALLDDLNARASIVLSRMNRLQLEIERVRLLIDTTPPEDHFEIARLFTLLRSYQLEYSREAAIYRPLAVQGRSVEAEIGNLADRRQATVNRFEGQMKNLNKAYVNLERRAKRIDSDQRKVDRTSPTGNTPRVRAKDALTSALTTYEPFPLEQEKQKLLDSFRKAD